MKKGKVVIILVNLVILLTWFNLSVMKKEAVLTDGKLILFELAPVDPRSLMQGDYMRLRYKITVNQSPHTLPKRGYCIVKIKDHHVAEKVRFQPDKQPLDEGEYPVKYFYNNFFMNLGAESYFFEEGKGGRYAAARYGGLRVDENGNSVLSGLYDENFKLIQ